MRFSYSIVRFSHFPMRWNDFQVRFSGFPERWSHFPWRLDHFLMRFYVFVAHLQHSELRFYDSCAVGVFDYGGHSLPVNNFARGCDWFVSTFNYHT